MDELAAVKESQTGDREAFGVLIDLYYKNIYRYAYHCTGNHQDADDICQETFLRALKEIRQLKKITRFREWIFTIASNLSRKRIKKIKMNRNYVETSIESLNQKHGDKNMHPFENVTKSEKASIIQDHLQDMSEHLRMVTVLVLMQDLAQKEAAKILNRSEPSISRDLNDAKAWLQSRLHNLR